MKQLIYIWVASLSWIFAIRLTAECVRSGEQLIEAFAGGMLIPIALYFTRQYCLSEK